MEVLEVSEAEGWNEYIYWLCYNSLIDILCIQTVVLIVAIYYWEVLISARLSNSYDLKSRPRRSKMIIEEIKWEDTSERKERK